MILLFAFIIGTYTQTCPQNLNPNSYQFSTSATLASTPQQWNYNTLNSVNTNTNFTCTSPETNPKQLSSTEVELYELEIVLDMKDEIEITVNKTIGPQAQYQTNDIRILVQGLKNYVTYQSLFFQFKAAENQLDFYSSVQSGELQIYFLQESLYDLCDVEPLYAVLAFPIYTVSETNTLEEMQIQFTPTESTFNISFRNNITKTIKSDSSSYVQYQSIINLLPCSTANWYVSTKPLFISQIQLTNLLSLNQWKGVAHFSLSNDVNLSKGKIMFQGDKEFSVGDDTTEWAATWVASIIPCAFFAFIVCIYGQYELSNIGRYKRPEEKKHEVETEALKQEEVDHKLA